MDWNAWHDRYDDPDSRWSERLRAVRAHVGAALDAAPSGEIRALSVCAGQGRDLIPVLAEHPRGRDVRARLVELDPGNTERARAAARAAGLDGVQVVTGDASLTDAYLGLAPAHLVLVAGIFGNIVPADIRATVRACAALCARDGIAIWTRNRAANPALIGAIGDWFTESGFEQVGLSGSEVDLVVGAQRLARDPDRLRAGQRMSEFIGYEAVGAPLEAPEA